MQILYTAEATAHGGREGQVSTPDGYLDPDVCEWLEKHAPTPRHGQNYHQWLSSQYGLKKLIEHIWMLIGMATVCHDMRELRQRMAEKFGREGVQFTMYLPPPGKRLPQPERDDAN